MINIGVTKTTKECNCCDNAATCMLYMGIETYMQATKLCDACLKELKVIVDKDIIRRKLV